MSDLRTLREHACAAADHLKTVICERFDADRLHDALVDVELSCKAWVDGHKDVIALDMEPA